jgi:membrane protease YdiL (CAAX protease family)
MAQRAQNDPEAGPASATQRRAFRLTLLLGLILIPVSFGLARLTSIDLLALLHPGVDAVLIGIAATVSLALLLAWFMRTQWSAVAELRRSQIEFLSEIGFDLTPARILLLSLVAGISEELFFRGVLQTVIDRHSSILIAIVLTNIVFGALHARTPFYAIAAGFAGAYFGFLFWETGSLAAPIIAHAAYDYVALEWARRAIADFRRSDQSGRAKSSASSANG